MKSKLILSTTVAIFTLAACVIAEEAKYPPINPALIYWQAAAEMPDLKGEKSDLIRDIVSGKKPFDATKAEPILAESVGALGLFAKAADSTAPCDWGLQLQDGPGTPLPHLSKVRELCRLAILKSDALFAEGKPSEGVEWLLATQRAARHAGAGDLLINALVQISIEASVIKAAALHCLAWDEATRQRYADGLKALPPLHSVQDATRGEMMLVDWIERRFQPVDAKARQKIQDKLSAANQPDGKANSEFDAAIKMFQGQLTPEQLPKLTAGMRDLYLRTQVALGKPWKEGQAELQAIIKESQEGNILIKLMFPSFVDVNAKSFEIATLRTMLDAALQYGPKLDEAAAGSFKDAFDGEPLILKKGEDGGLTLSTSRQYWKGKDVELKVGK